MAEITLRQALQKGLSEAIENDPDVFIMGEDTSGSSFLHSSTSLDALYCAGSAIE